MIRNDNAYNLIRIIDKDVETDGDYWIHLGNNLIHDVLNTFSHADWQVLIVDLTNWADNQLSIFSRAVLIYNTDSIDTVWVFGYIFTILKDLEDCSCLIDNLYFLENLKERDYDLLMKVKHKIELVEISHSETDSSLNAKVQIDTWIKS